MSRARGRDGDPAGREPLLAASGLAIGYRRRALVRGIDLEVGAGDFWFLLGPNASGKTTFARTVLGLLPAVAGTLRRSAVLARGGIGYVPQHCALHPTLPMTVSEYVDLGLAAQRVARAEARQRVEAALAAVALGERGGSDMNGLSGGLRQRAMVARALVRDPQMLVLDEPTSNLDPVSEEALLSALVALRRERGMTLLFVSHDLAVATRHASHVAFFHDGRFESGDRGLLMQEELLRQVYGLDICVGLDESGHATLHVESPPRAAEPAL